MRSLYIFLLCLIAKWSYGQELSHKQYTVKDGLPGSIIYHSLQDKEGFIWFATNQGVSRFDGRSFRNFTKEDGLPDNDILRLYMDRHGNIWFISLMGIPSVLYNGRIRRMDSCKGVVAIQEDNLTDSIFFTFISDRQDQQFIGYYQSPNTPGHWHFTSRLEAVGSLGWVPQWSILKESSPVGINFYYAVRSTNAFEIFLKTRQMQKTYSFPLSQNVSSMPYSRRFFWTLSADKKALLFFINDSLYYVDQYSSHSLFSLHKFNLRVTRDGDISSLYCEDDSTLWVTTRGKGLLRIRNFLQDNRTVESFFPESFCTSIFKDREGCYWITTHNNGVYYLPNLHFHYLSTDLAAKDIKCIRSLGGQRLGAGSADGDIMEINYNDLTTRLYPAWTRQNKNNRILDICPCPGSRLLIGTDGGAYLFSGEGAWKKLGEYMAVKSLYVGPGPVVALGTAGGVELLDLAAGSDKKIYGLRATCIAGIGNRYLWATFNGMREYSGDSVKDLAHLYPPLSGIINHIDIAPDSSLWVSTQDGIAILRNGRLHLIQKGQGLLGNTCKHVLFSGNTAWVSTDKGIARIDYTWEEDRLRYSISDITEEDGLNSNDVNQTALAGDNIWAATARGICYFPQYYISRFTSPPLVNINRVVAGNKELLPTDTVRLEGPNSRLLIELSGISFRSGRKIRYEYRLNGVDSNWIGLDNNNALELSALPFGEFVFEVRAIDRWANRSDRSRRMIILHPPPFWRSTWFTILTYLVTVFLIGLAFYIFNRQRHRKKEGEYRLKRKMNDLEMMALRTQMDPHFIFNCLSSIQHHILKADTKNANLYLHKFSTLIRKILQCSPVSAITLTEEIEMLTLYLELEKMRLGDRMEHQIHITDDLRHNELYIPAMIIQPYVENAIRHGIVPLQEKKGILRIEFRKEGGHIVCSIEDNGIGVNRSRQNKSVSVVGHISMGTGNTGSRISIFNEIHENKILLQIIDKEGTDPMTGIDPLTTGTVVKLSFPITMN